MAPARAGVGGNSRPGRSCFSGPGAPGSRISSPGKGRLEALPGRNRALQTTGPRHPLLDRRHLQHPGADPHDRCPGGAPPPARGAGPVGRRSARHRAHRCAARPRGGRHSGGRDRGEQHGGGRGRDLRHGPYLRRAGAGRPVPRLGFPLQREAGPADTARRPAAGSLRVGRGGELRLERPPPARWPPRRAPHQPLPDREAVTGGLLGRGRLRPPSRPVPGDRRGPRDRRPGGPREGRPRARGARQHVDPARLPPGGLGGTEARRRPDREQLPNRRREGVRRVGARGGGHRQPAARPGGLRVRARGGVPGQRHPHAPPVPGLRGRGRRPRAPGPRRALVVRLLGLRRADPARLRGHEGQPARDPREAGRRRPHGPGAGREGPAGAGSRGDPDRRRADRRERARERTAGPTDVQHPDRTPLRNGEGSARVRQGRRLGALRAHLDGVRAGKGRGGRGPSREGRTPEPGRGRAGVHGVGEGAGLHPPAQPEHVRFRRAGGAAPRGE